MKKAVVLLSGGLDSTTVLAIARTEGFACHALSFDYGQRHRFELDAAARVARHLGANEHKTVRVDLRAIGSSSALTSELVVPKDRAAEDMSDGIPVTYVPCRNLVFLSIAAGWAEALGARDIYLGVNVLDYSGYPDCRPAFLDAFEDAVNMGTKAGVEGRTFKLHAPLIQLTKAQIVAWGGRLGVDFALTHSCYDPDGQGHACGRCDSCLLRSKGFAEAGVPDPTSYMRRRLPGAAMSTGRPVH